VCEIVANYIRWVCSNGPVIAVHYFPPGGGGGGQLLILERICQLIASLLVPAAPLPPPRRIPPPPQLPPWKSSQTDVWFFSPKMFLLSFASQGFCL
jgi:hypothetical protein